MGVEELGQRLIGAGLIEAASAEAQREHEDVQDARLLAEAHRGGPPVDLALGPGRRLEARHRPLGQQRACLPQPVHHGLIARLQEQPREWSRRLGEVTARVHR